MDLALPAEGVFHNFVFVSVRKTCLIEENTGRRFPTPLAIADQDGCRGEGEGGKVVCNPLITGAEEEEKQASSEPQGVIGEQDPEGFRTLPAEKWRWSERIAALCLLTVTRPRS